MTRKIDRDVVRVHRPNKVIGVNSHPASQFEGHGLRRSVLSLRQTIMHKQYLHLHMKTNALPILIAALLVSGCSGLDSRESKQSPQTSWPDTAAVNLNGTLEVGYKMGGLGQNGINLTQLVTLNTGTNTFVLRLFPGTKCDVPLTKKPLHLAVEGVKVGVAVAAGAEYDVE